MKINLGCGTNKLDGWQNFDADVDITKRLPFDDECADFVFAEHVVEHVTYEQALAFFAECHRVLKVSGVCRIAVPSVVRVWREATPDYMQFTRKWSRPRDETEPSQRRAAMANILIMHGHKAPWSQEILLASLYYAGFDGVAQLTPGHSERPELRGVEGHGRVISEYFNWIETVVAEATKQ